VANGEIWNVQDALQARAESGCFDLMLGRGIVTNPGLGWAIQAHDAGVDAAIRVIDWDDVAEQMATFWSLVAGHVSPRHQAGRLKQWLNFLRRHYPQAQLAYDHLRTINDPHLVHRWILDLKINSN
jgi:tRNA-dihydrouridine synthase C